MFLRFSFANCFNRVFLALSMSFFLFLKGLGLVLPCSDLPFCHFLKNFPLFFFLEEQQPPELSAKNVHVNCITFLGEKVCQVSCKAKFVPIRPHANSYTYFNGQWTTDPEGYEFPWADCVPGKQNP